MPTYPTLQRLRHPSAILRTDGNRIREREPSFVEGLSNDHAVNTTKAHTTESFQIFKGCNSSSGRDLEARRLRDQARLIDIYAGESAVALDVCINDSLDASVGNPASQSQRAYLLLG